MNVAVAPVVCKPDDWAVVLITSVVILHASVNYTADRLVNVVRAHILEKLDHFKPGRLAHTSTLM